ncbi:MAG: hypothetical protein GY934_16410 [Gammaproteobacteria bacterium]|nr:hypothetical protein [Gammaproteobacteria bacterium]
MRKLLLHPKSILWTDIVGESVVQGSTGIPELATFLTGMDKLGEPFIFGHDHPSRFFKDLGFEVIHTDPSSLFMDGNRDRVFDLYRFVVLRQGG